MEQNCFPSDKKPNYVFKICLFGEQGVGKRSFLKAIGANSFDDTTKLTIGITFYTYDYPFGPKEENNFIRFSIWVSELSSHFIKMFSYYLSGSNAILIMFDCSDINSLKIINNSIEKINKYHLKGSYNILLGNKIDLVSKSDKVKIIANKIVDKYQLNGYYEISALRSSNIKKPFIAIAEHYLEIFGLKHN